MSTSLLTTFVIDSTTENTTSHQDTIRSTLPIITRSTLSLSLQGTHQNTGRAPRCTPEHRTCSKAHTRTQDMLQGAQQNTGRAPRRTPEHRACSKVHTRTQGVLQGAHQNTGRAPRHNHRSEVQLTVRKSRKCHNNLPIKVAGTLGPFQVRTNHYHILHSLDKEEVCEDISCHGNNMGPLLTKSSYSLQHSP